MERDSPFRQVTAIELKEWFALASDSADKQPKYDQSLADRDLPSLPKSFPKFWKFQSRFALHSFRYSSSKKVASCSEMRPFVRADAMVFPQIRFSSSLRFMQFLRFKSHDDTTHVSGKSRRLFGVEEPKLQSLLSSEKLRCLLLFAHNLDLVSHKEGSLARNDAVLRSQYSPQVRHQLRSQKALTNVGWGASEGR